MNVLLLDRDGVLNEERGYLFKPDGIALLPGVIDGLRRFKGWRLFVVSNQSAIGRGMCTTADVDATNARVAELLKEHGVIIEDVVYCPHTPEDGCDCRKPAIGQWKILRERYGLDARSCAMVGNRDSDMQFARAIGSLAVRVEDPRHPMAVRPDLCVRSLDELADVLLEDRVLTMEEAAVFAEQKRKEGKTVVTTNGAFDLLHDGHRFLLEEGRKHGDVVIVGINSDASVRKGKGPDRPVEKQEFRARKVARFADAVFVFDDPDPRAWLKEIRPNVHLNAETYGRDCVEAPVLKDIGARLVLVPVRKELGSTTALLHTQ